MSEKKTTLSIREPSIILTPTRTAKRCEEICKFVRTNYRISLYTPILDDSSHAGFELAAHVTAADAEQYPQACFQYCIVRGAYAYDVR